MDRRSAAQADEAALATRHAELPSGPLALEEAVDLALEHNFRAALARQERLIAEEEAVASRLDQLGQLKASATYTDRSEPRATSSESYFSGHETLSPSFSTESEVGSSRLALTWNLLDFGLAYLRSRQAEDRAQMRGWQEVRTRQRLALAVGTAWCRAAAAEALAGPAATLAREARQRLEARQEAVGEDLSEVDVLQYQRALARSEARLTEIRQRRDEAIATLRRLLHAKPGAAVEVPALTIRTLPSAEAQVDVASLEREALRSRPELYEADLEGGIAYDELRANLWSMAPSPGMMLSHEASTNDFLTHSNWWTVGIDAAWDLMSLPRKLAERRAGHLEHELAAERRKTLAFGVLNQVRVSLIERAAALKGLRLADEYFALQDRLVQSLARQVEAGQASKDALFTARVDRFLARARLVDGHTAYWVAEARLHTALGRMPAALPIRNAMAETAAPAPQPASREGTEASSL